MTILHVTLPDGTDVEATDDISRVQAPVTIKGYLLCSLAAFGGIFFGYDSGYVNGIMGMPYFISLYTGLNPATTPPTEFGLPAWEKSLIVAILSAGTFFGSIIAGDSADFFGRRTTILGGCAVFAVGVALQTASTGIGLFAAGRVVAGLGIGSVTAIVVLYVSEICPEKIRGAVVSVYGLFICIGLLVAACVDYGTQHNTNSSSYRIPVAIQFVWAIILSAGLVLLPESPRYFVRKGRPEKAAAALARLRSQPQDSEQVHFELAEIIANHQYELQLNPHTTYIASWTNCLRGGLRNPSSNLRRTLMGTSMLAFQQWGGANFIFYSSTTFFQQLGTIQNPFLMGIILTLVNVCSTPIAFWTYEHWGRRPVLLYGAAGMATCQYLVAIVGSTVSPDNKVAVRAEIALICIYIFIFAPTWGPRPWIVAGEIFPLHIRARGIGISAASNWFWNCIIGVITPYLLGPQYGNLGTKVFTIWGSACVLAFLFVYFLVPETKGISLEQIDKLLEEVSPRKSSK
ncbi:hypothetical protein H2200_006826 [Cladophialophora chaetospira]|uniref:Major facilitator superfamily (MFS) profile domain-containing protein n=1 Tax=Cladophialophora chaetospira TaxID=386627 RepID=A0AA38X932_9EURO|nr:hypothetical protein H2200_006826 [Cladophialophora chaetospira]